MHFKLAFAAALTSLAVPVMTARAAPLFGVNLSGLEMGNGNIANSNYAVPSPAYMASQNVAVMRLPFTIERLQPTANTAFNSAYSGYIMAIAKANIASNVYTVLDPHNYGYIFNDGTTREIGVDATGTANYLGFMATLATTFRGMPMVAIGLMNEPHDQTCAQLTPVWQQAITAIRSTGFSGPIMVPPTNWSHADTFVSNGCGADFVSLTDPANNLVFEVHNYLDPNQSGTYTQAISSVTVGSQQLASVVAWAAANKKRLFVGETGTPPDSWSVSALDSELQTIKNNPGQFWGVTLWASGPWWPTSYVMRLDPVNGVSEPQMVDLAKYLSRPEELVIGLVEDSFQGNAQYSLTLDGSVVATSTEAMTRAGNVPDMVAVPGPFASGSHTMKVTFLNDLYQGSAAKDRNLYFVGATFNGQTLSAPAVELPSTGSSTTIRFVAP